MHFLGDGGFLEVAVAICCGVHVQLPYTHHADYMFLYSQLLCLYLSIQGTYETIYAVGTYIVHLTEYCLSCN